MKKHTYLLIVLAFMIILISFYISFVKQKKNDNNTNAQEIKSSNKTENEGNILSMDYVNLSIKEKNILEKYSTIYKKSLLIKNNSTQYSSDTFSLKYYDKDRALIIPPAEVTGFSPELVSLKDYFMVDETFGRGDLIYSDKYIIFFVDNTQINFYRAGDNIFSKIQKPFVLNKLETLITECDFTSSYCPQDIKIVNDELIVSIYKETKKLDSGYQKNIKLREVRVRLN